MTQLSDEASVEDLWQDLKDCMLEDADEVCGPTKKPPRHKETWWWNDEVKLVVEEKRRLLKSWKNTKNEEDKKKQNAAKNRAKNVIGKVQQEQRLRFIEDLEQENEKGNIFKVTR